MVSSKVTRQQEAAEAICSALYETHFRFLGDSDEGASSWFTRGVSPKIMRVEIYRAHADGVLINIEWPNLTQRGVIVKGRETNLIPIDPGVSHASVKEATVRATVRILEIYRDVLEGKGVAGSEALKGLDFRK